MRENIAGHGASSAAAENWWEMRAKGLALSKPMQYHRSPIKGRGAVAQLGERSVRNAEVVGSIPIGSTKSMNSNRRLGGSFFLTHREPPKCRLTFAPRSKATRYRPSSARIESPGLLRPDAKGDRRFAPKSEIVPDRQIPPASSPLGIAVGEVERTKRRLRAHISCPSVEEIIKRYRLIKSKSITRFE